MEIRNQLIHITDEEAAYAHFLKRNINRVFSKNLLERYPDLHKKIQEKNNTSS